LHEALQGFKIGDCDSWLSTASERAKQQRSSVSDAIKRRELLEEFIYWFFEFFVLPLVKVSVQGSLLFPENLSASLDL